jgi:uncharacterized membrane protein YqaE (UPF0057 family)
MDAMKLLLCIVALFCPPLAVALGGGTVADFLINLLLTLVFFLPGVVHAWYIILSGPMYQMLKLPKKNDQL